MSSTAGERGSPSAQVRQYAEIRALDEAKRVPWRLLANAAHEYTEWQVFALWLRAVLDVCEELPAEEYRAGHIPGAISIPLKELEARLSTLPRDRETVAYCRGPYCVLAVDAVKLLRSRGLCAVRLDDGVPEWRAGGLPVAAGEQPI